MLNGIESILIADDNSAFRTSLKSFLETEGFSVSEAHDGEEAIHLFEQSPSDLVLLDLVMPKKEGFETMEDLLKINPGQKIIVMTGGNRWISHFYLDAAREQGAKVVLQKPFSVDALLEAIKSL